LLVGDDDLDTMTQEQLETKLKGMIQGPAWVQMEAMYDKYVSADNLTISFMRSFVFNGGPIKNETFRFDNTSHFREE